MDLRPSSHVDFNGSPERVADGSLPRNSSWSFLHVRREVNASSNSGLEYQDSYIGLWDGWRFCVAAVCHDSLGSICMHITHLLQPHMLCNKFKIVSASCLSLHESSAAPGLPCRRRIWLPGTEREAPADLSRTAYDHVWATGAEGDSHSWP